MLNSVALLGRLSADVDKKVIKVGEEEKPVYKFSLAVNEGKDKVSFIECVYFGENKAIDTLHKGSKIVVVGRLSQRKFTRKDGSTASTLEVIISSVDFAETKVE